MACLGVIDLHAVHSHLTWKMNDRIFQRRVISGTRVTREVKQLFGNLPQKNPEEVPQNFEAEAVWDRGADKFEVFDPVSR